MTSLLAEQPLLIALMLAATAAALIYGWLQTGKRAAGVIGLIMIALIPGAWILAQRWVTEGERIEQIIYEVADAVEANDHQRVLQVIGDSNTRAQARAELPRYVFDQADVTSIRSIDVVEGSYPPIADVDMMVKVTVSQKEGALQNVQVPRRLLLTFQKRESGQWVVVDYRHTSVTGRPDAYSTRPR